MGLLYIPKFYIIYTKKDVSSSNFKKTQSFSGRPATTQTSELSSLSSDDVDRLKKQKDELSRRNAELQREVMRLKRALQEAHLGGSSGVDTGSSSDDESETSGRRHRETIVQLNSEFGFDEDRYSDSASATEINDTARLNIKRRSAENPKKSPSRDSLKGSSSKTSLNKSPSKDSVSGMTKSQSKDAITKSASKDAIAKSSSKDALAKSPSKGSVQKSPSSGSMKNEDIRKQRVRFVFF